MYARITRDLLGGSRVGYGRGTPGTAQDEVLTFRLLDDDGEVYYKGRGDSEGRERMFNFFMADSGTTYLEIHVPGQGWKAELG